MCSKDDLKEVMNKLYDMLRNAENVSLAKYLLIYDVESVYTKK
jgi:hypothetical protein